MAKKKIDIKKLQFKGMPDPWVYGTNFDGNPCVKAIDTKAKWTIGEMFIVEELSQDTWAEQDAHLIASAPELLKAAVDLLVKCHEQDIALPVVENEALQKAIIQGLNLKKNPFPTNEAATA